MPVLQNLELKPHSRKPQSGLRVLKDIGCWPIVSVVILCSLLVSHTSAQQTSLTGPTQNSQTDGTSPSSRRTIPQKPEAPSESRKFIDDLMNSASKAERSSENDLSVLEVVAPGVSIPAALANAEQGLAPAPPEQLAKFRRTAQRNDSLVKPSIKFKASTGIERPSPQVAGQEIPQVEVAGRQARNRNLVLSKKDELPVVVDNRKSLLRASRSGPTQATSIPPLSFADKEAEAISNQAKTDVFIPPVVQKEAPFAAKNQVTPDPPQPLQQQAELPAAPVIAVPSNLLKPRIVSMQNSSPPKPKTIPPMQPTQNKTGTLSKKQHERIDLLMRLAKQEGPQSDGSVALPMQPTHSVQAPSTAQRTKVNSPQTSLSKHEMSPKSKASLNLQGATLPSSPSTAPVRNAVKFSFGDEISR